MQKQNCQLSIVNCQFNLEKAIKLLVVFLAFCYIGYRLYSSENISFTFINQLLTFEKIGLWTLFLVLYVSNFLIDVFRWKKLLEPVQYISSKTSFVSNLAGITAGIFTPNRIGELAGKILFLEKKNRISGVFAAFIGGANQSLATVIGCFLACIYFFFGFSGNVQFPILTRFTFLFLPLSFGILLVLPIVYWFYKNNKSRIVKNKLFQKYQTYFAFAENYKKKQKIEIYFLSFLRYIVYCSQFAVLLYIVGVKESISVVVVSITYIYMALTFLPTVSIAELGIRGALAVFFVSDFYLEENKILFTTAFLWLCNLALPAIVGGIVSFMRIDK